MSIKSHKSLQEECSEIWERSYSVRSESLDSIVTSDENECLSRVLLSAMNPAVLSKLRKKFRKGKFTCDVNRRADKIMRLAAAEEGIEFTGRAEPQGDVLWIDEETFVQAFKDIYGNHKHAVHAQKLFQSLDLFNTKKVYWSDLIDRMVEVGAKKTRSRSDIWNLLTEKQCHVKQLMHCQRETIVKIVSIESENCFSYSVISRGGRVGVYSGSMKMLQQYDLWYHRLGVKNRIKNRWVTDALYATDIQYLIVSASDRSFTVCDASTLTHTLLHCITGFPNIPTCMSYQDFRDGESELVIGDERGKMTRVQFLQPYVTLLPKKHTDRVNAHLWSDLKSPLYSNHCQITSKKVHNRSIRRIHHWESRNVIVSSSNDSSKSVVFLDRSGKLDPYVIAVHRGITCFDLVPSLQLLVSGSPDGRIRMYTYTQCTPHAVLYKNGRTCVVDVAVHKDLEIVIAFYKDCTFDIWDIYEECLLQTMNLKFPFLCVVGKKPDFGTYSIHPGPLRLPIKEEIPGHHDLLEVQDLSLRRNSITRSESGGYFIDIAECEDSSKERTADKFRSQELLITCCDFVAMVTLGELSDPVAPPPLAMKDAKTPDCWSFMQEQQHIDATPKKQDPELSSARSLTPEPISLHQDNIDIEQLLDDAGLHEILSKCFVSQMNLKSDLNKKLGKLQDDMKFISSRVKLGVPFLACNVKCYLEDVCAPSTMNSK